MLAEKDILETFEKLRLATREQREALLQQSLLVLADQPQDVLIFTTDIATGGPATGDWGLATKEEEERHAGLE